MSLPTEDELELMLLASFVRIARYGRDRRPAGTLVAVDHGSGLPLHERDLLPVDAAVKGDALALESVIRPDQMAQALLDLVGRRRTQWTWEETEACAVLEQRLRIVAGRLGERGILVRQPPVMDDGAPMPLGDDGLPRIFAISAAGLRHAKDRIRGTRYDTRGPVSIVDALPADVRRNAPDWAQREAKRLD